eukprot:gene10159-11897_t
MPSSIGQYCSRDCQLVSCPFHNPIHNLVETANKSVLSFQGIAESIALAMKDASTRYLLPDLGDSQTVSILLAGCRDFVEGSVDFYTLYELLVALDVFPGKAIQYLEVTLCGPELTSRPPFYHPSGRVKVVRASGRLQRQFPVSTTSTSLPELAVSQFSSTIDIVNASHYVSFNTYNGAPAVAPAAALYDSFSCVFIRQPGFSITKASLLQRSPQKEGILSMLEQWVPAIRLLLNSGVLVLVAEYPDHDSDGQNGTSTNNNKIPSLEASHNLQLPPVSPTTQANSADRNKAQQKVTFSTHQSPPSNHLSPASTKHNTTSPTKTPTPSNTETSAEYYLDLTFHANIVIPATPYPFRRQKWSAPFPVLFPYPPAVPHPEVYEPLRYFHSSGEELLMAEISSDDSSAKASNYMQGSRDPQVTHQIKFFTSMAELNAHLRNTCLLIARELGAGLLRLPLHWPPEELELEAHRRDMILNPLKKQLLEKEKQEILKRNDLGKGATVQAPVLQFTRR